MFERCLYFNVNALARAVNRHWEQAFQELDLSPAHGYLLRLVLAEPGITQKAIAEELRLDKSTITRFVDALQERGLLKRSKLGAEDSREVRITATAKAKRLQEALEAKGDELYRKMCGTVGEDEMKALVVRLREVTKTLS